MSQSNRPEPRGAAHRSRRQVRLEAITFLEERKLLAPVVASTVPVATFTAAATPTNTDLGTVTVSQVASSIGASAAPLTSVSELTSANSFGGDIVSIQAGPGGDFGKGVYAISRGAGENADATSRNASIQAPINRPGVIYRVDPATGKTSVFFDLNTVANQLTQGGTATNGSTPGSGLVNWYSMSFDPEGVFDGKPSLFVSSLSQTDPTKNVIYRIGPDGSFMGAYVQFTAGSSAQSFVVQPSAVFVPPVEQQNFLKGIFVGQGSGSSAFNGTAAGNFEALFFDANSFRPGQDLSGTSLPTGVSQTPFSFGPQVGFTAENSSYTSPDASAFTDFGTPGAGGIPAAPGLSGVQGLQGELQIGGGTIVNSFTAAGGATPDTAGAILTPFRRFESIAFDQYGYFSYGLGAAAVTPTYQGSTFVADLGTGLSVQVTPVAPFATTPINVPIQGPGGPIGVQLGADGTTVEPIFTNDSTTGGNLGGRIIRITPAGVVTVFAENFHTSGAQDANAFLQSSLSITFSADGTTLYAADDDGIWQFKTVTDIANASSGQLVGLGDLRALGVPYDGQDSAVAIVDTGVDSLTPNFRGRVSTGVNVLNNSPGNDDTAAAGNGHGTVVAGVIAQFVPQATLDPINVFTPNQVVGGSVGGSLGGNATTPQNIYIGLDFLAKNPFVADPVRPNHEDRVITSEIAFGTSATFPVETAALKSFPQVTLAFAAEFQKFRALGIQPIAAAGQFGGVGTTGASVTGNVTGISFPAVLNEVISVTGSYSYPFTNTATSTPDDPGSGFVPRPSGPLLLYTTGGTTVGTTINGQGSASVVSAGDALVFKDKILASSNRSLTTDFTAPETDIPSFSRTVSGTVSGTVAGSVGGTGGNPTVGFNNFTSGGTSLSSAIVTGSYAMVESALNYWINIANNNGVTVDGYLNTPAEARLQSRTGGKGGIGELATVLQPRRHQRNPPVDRRARDRRPQHARHDQPADAVPEHQLPRVRPGRHRQRRRRHRRLDRAQLPLRPRRFQPDRRRQERIDHGAGTPELLGQRHQHRPGRGRRDGQAPGRHGYHPDHRGPAHVRRRAARSARRPPEAVQLLRLRHRRATQRRDLDRSVPGVVQGAAPRARRLHGHRPPEVVGRWLPDLGGPAEELLGPAAHAADLRLHPQERGEAVQEHLAREVRRGQGADPLALQPDLHALRQRAGPGRHQELPARQGRDRRREDRGQGRDRREQARGHDTRDDRDEFRLDGGRQPGHHQPGESDRHPPEQPGAEQFPRDQYDLDDCPVDPQAHRHSGRRDGVRRRDHRLPEVRPGGEGVASRRHPVGDPRQFVDDPEQGVETACTAPDQGRSQGDRLGLAPGHDEGGGQHDRGVRDAYRAPPVGPCNGPQGVIRDEGFCRRGPFARPKIDQEALLLVRKRPSNARFSRSLPPPTWEREAASLWSAHGR